MSAAPRSDVTTHVTSVPVEEFLSTVTNERGLRDARHTIRLGLG